MRIAAQQGELVFVQALDGLAVEFDLAAVGRVDQAAQVEDGAFAAARWAGQRQQLATGHTQIHALQRGNHVCRPSR
jgi:hypothetical protein